MATSIRALNCRCHIHLRAGGLVYRLTCLVAAAATLMLVLGCSHPKRVRAVPQDDTTRATIPGIPDARYWAEIDHEPFLRAGIDSVRRELAYRAQTGQSGALPPAYGLAISGGGANGAFGAGLIVGWTAAGNRPDFKLVTGISTGALTAPFAFLGPKYDDVLREVYTTVSSADVFKPRGPLAALYDDAMADTGPLWKLVEQYINQDLLREIGQEYDKGRLLMIATTDLDARQPVVWNVGAIAKSGDPKALKLFRSILVASAAIPGAFPPVMIDVEIDGKRYQEMHVDGGAMAQVIIYPPSLRIEHEAKKRGVTRERKLYVIRNARLDPKWTSVERKTLDIAGRAISSLIHTQGIGDLYQMYLIAQRDGLDYNLAYIPADFAHQPKEEFDQAYMRELFDHGYQLARDGYPWQKYPPGFAASEDE